MPSHSDSLLIRRHKLLEPAYSLFYKEPLHIVRGEGVWLYDADGRKYLDMYNNVPHVGHCHPAVVEATLPPHVVAVPAPDVYRGRYRGGDAAERYASHVEGAIETLRGRGIAPAALRRARYFNTFGGNPVSAAAGLAVLDVMQAERLQQNALEVGRRLLSGLARLAGRHERIGDVRGTGLFLAAELVEDRESRTPATDYAERVVEALRHEGVLTNTIGRDENILKLRPPMVLSRQNADMFLDILDRVLSAR